MRTLVLASILAVCIPGVLRAQEPTEAAEAKATELAKATQNPVADMNSIPFQFNFTSGGDLGDATQSVLNIQPVLPLPINAKWNLISRTIIPVTNLPGPGGERLTGIADIQEQLFLTPAKSGGLIWGVGPIVSFPTATNPALETGQFAIGPAFVMLKMSGPWVFGFVANQLWRFAGSETSTEINNFFVQPFINYNLKRGWAISTAPSITASWEAPSGEEWTVPLGIGVSKITMVGKQPMNLALQYYHNVERPTGAGADLVRMQFTLLYPKGQ